MLEVTLKARKGRRRKRQEDTREGGRRKHIRHSSRPIHVVTDKRRKAEDKKNVDEETLRGVFGGVDALNLSTRTPSEVVVSYGHA